MKAIGAFDVIGPNMIGPSSSHTAGALRIASLARKITRGTIASVHFVLYGSFAQTYKGHGTDRALVGGILGFEPDDHRIRDSFRYAEDSGIAVSFATDADKEAHPNTVDIHVTCTNGDSMHLRGISTGGGRAELRAINGVDIKLSGEYSTIFIKQQDRPGLVAHVAGILSQRSINIAFMRLYREQKGENAYVIIEADQEISADVACLIEEHPGIISAILIEH